MSKRHSSHLTAECRRQALALVQTPIVSQVELAVLARTSPSRVKAALAAGQFHTAYQIGQRRWRIPIDEARSWIARGCPIKTTAGRS